MLTLQTDLNDQELRFFVKPTGFVSLSWQSVLLQCYVHVVWRVPVVFMRGKCVKAIHLFYVLENCAVCLVSLQESKVVCV